MTLVNLTETISSSAHQLISQKGKAGMAVSTKFHQISQLAESPTNLSDTKAEATSIKGSNDCSHS